jgi:tight adherence protein C
MDQQLLLMFCIAGMVGLAAYGLSRLLMGETDEKLRQRLSTNDPDGAGSSRTGASAGETVVPILQKIGQAAASPFMPKSRETISGLRRSLGYAGIYSPMAIKLVTGAKAIALCVGLFGGYALGLVIDNMLLGIPVGALIAYYIPKLWLRIKINENQRKLTIGLPDALDLMVVCVEAGLTVDSAMQRVGQELGLAHPALSRELGIAHMETRVGLSRSEALKNLGVRTGNPALQSLASMLIQAERFGTSIAGALRIHAESLRTKRQHAAEEMAAKASVKLSFPLVLFIFPATFIVLAGPTVINLMRSSLFE